MSDTRRGSAESAEVNDTLAGGGEMGALMRSMDWSATRLGPVQRWPQSLRTTVSTCLNSRFPILIWWGPELVMLYNDAYQQIIGTKHPQSLGAPGREVWPEIWDVIGPMLDSARRDGKGTWSENLRLFLNRFGFAEETYFTFSYSPIRDESGGIGGVFSAISETTGQVLSERRLRALRDLAALTTGARSTEEACRLAAQAMDGYGDDLPFALLYAVEDQGPRLVGGAGAHAAALAGSSWRPQLDEVLRTQRPELVGWLQPRPDAGSPTRALILPIGLPGEGHPVAVMIAGLSMRLAFDDRYRSFLELMAGTLASAAASARALQDSKRRAEALAELDRAKTAFFSNISHEFRTPLTLMLGPTEDLLSGAHGALAPAQRAQLELLRRNELRLQRLVNALLEFSRIESGRAKATFEETDLCALTRDLAGSFRSAVERAGLAFVVDCALDEPAWVDPDLWEQIVLNLLSNALKFTFEGRIDLSLRAAGDQVVLQVKDTGVGIRAEELPRLFERFHRVEGTRARTHEGSGIGLALVQELVKLHGGAVGVQSAQGAGTTFTVQLPRGNRHLPREQLGHRDDRERGPGRAVAFAEEAMRWLPPEDEGPPQNAWEGSARIVVADDNADMRDYLRRILSSRWEVELAADGRAALEAVHRRRPDVVLTDVMMPVLDGFGLLRELRADPATATVPVVMLSARAGEESRVEGLEAGADDYLVKPFSARELLARVSTHIRLTRAQSALEHQWEEVRDILRLLPVAIAIVTLPEERYEFVNDAYLEMMGRDPTGRTMDEAWSDLSPEVLERLREVRRRVLASEEPVLLPDVPRAVPSRAQERHSQERHYAVSMRAWTDLAGRRRLISTATDVTDQVVARQQIEQSREQIARSERELRKAMTLRDDFFTMASHELRTPLTTLGLEAEGLLRSIEQAPLGDPPLDRWAHRAARLAGQAMRLEQLIEGMLDLAGLSGELSPGREEELDLSDLARSVVERFREGSQQARSSITLLAEPVCGRWERRRLERILTQLVANALKFGANNPIDVAVGPAGERARIAIKDRGIGIQLEDQERIFGRFERAAPPEHYGGFGVGLWMVGELVKSMSGSVRVDSRPGEGATFVIELPRRP